MTEDPLVVVLCTAPDEVAAERLAAGLVEARLAACVNVVPGLRSFYRWEGKLEHDDELQLIIKTRSARFDEVAAWLAEHHPYDVPEVVALSVMQASQAYGAWVKGQVERTQG
ncbi:MAG: divalent-cation tolerance protein CutA [Myxococcota bacterium]